MEQLFLNLAESSPVTLVAIYSIWRISVVMIKLADSLVEVTKANAASVSDLVDKQEAHPIRLQQAN